MRTCTLSRFPSFLFCLSLLFALVLGACSGEKSTSEEDVSYDAPLDVSTTGSRGRAHVADGTATSPKIGDDAVPRSKIEVGTVMTADIADFAITNQKLSPEAVTTDKILTGTILTEDIGSLQITNPLIATDAIDSRTIQNERLANQAQSNGTVMSTQLPYMQTKPVSGEWSFEITKTGTNAGTFHGVIQNEPILADDIPAGVVTTGEILNGSILGVQIANSVDRLSDTTSLTGNENEQKVGEIIPDVQRIPEPEPLHENAFRASTSSPYSTFSIDVDNASYSNVRGYLSRGTLPPADAVRIEELVNYFDYNYPDPTDEHPFAFHSEVVECPWNKEHLVVRLALQGERIQAEQAAACNLVFLIDVSGSMSNEDKLPLLKKSFKRLVDKLRPQDRVAVVVYAGAAGLVLESTPGSEKERIKDAIDKLESGGSTAGGAGIQLAYKVARDNYLPEGVNRVILATDGDFNVGVSGDDALVKLIEERRKDGVFLSILGFGTGNYQDAKMEKLADNGNGNYYYVDKLQEGERVLVEEMSGTLHAIAKDVKLQIKFNPAKVAAYRLIGYENRVLAAKDFDNDAKDAGELGAGHRVTALYEVVPVGAQVGFDLDTTKGEDYQLDEKRPELLSGHDLLLARLRYKEPKESVSKLIEHLVGDERTEIGKASEGTRFAMAVAEWGMALRGSKYIGTGSYDDVLALAKGASSHDPNGYRKEFIELVEEAKRLAETGGVVGSR